MSSQDLNVIRKMLAHDLMQVYVRLFLLLTVVWFSVEVLAPFLALALWSLILAVSLFPLNHWLAVRLHLSEGKAAVIFICIAFLIIGIPAGLLGASMAQHMGEWVMVLSEQGFTVPEADPAVAEWPVIGAPLYDLWHRAHEDLVSAAQMIQPQLIAGGRFLLAAAGNTLLALVLFFIALLIAGFMMANATSGGQQMRRLLMTFSDPARGEEIHELVVATIRSVSNGVVGVAVLQALALGVGFLVLDVPAAGVLALLVLFLGVLQLPSSPVVWPVLAWVWRLAAVGPQERELGSNSTPTSDRLEKPRAPWSAPRGTCRRGASDTELGRNSTPTSDRWEEPRAPWRAPSQGSAHRTGDRWQQSPEQSPGRLGAICTRSPHKPVG